MDMGKRGQVTVFILAGIGVLLAVILGLVVYDKVNEYKPPEEEIIRDVPTQILPVTNFVKECLHRTAKQGIHLIGRQGGYIDSSRFSVSPYPVRAEGLLFEPDHIPFWHHLEDCEGRNPACTPATARPGLCEHQLGCTLPFAADSFNNVENMLDDYIEAELPICLNHFEQFSDIFDITKSHPTADTHVSESDILIELDLPINITDVSGARLEWSKYVTRLNVDFKNIYKLAYNISSLQAQECFLENSLMNMISIYQGPGELEDGTPNPIPPVYHLDMKSQSPRIYTAPQVQEIFMYDLIPTMTTIMQFFETANYKRLMPTNWTDQYQEQIGIYDSFTIKLDDGEFYDVNSYIQYPYLPIELSFGGKSLLRSDSFPVTQYTPLGFLINPSTIKAEYDISFPIVITLEDSDAFAGEGFRFNFALEGNIRNNECASKGLPTGTGVPIVRGIDLLDPSQMPQRTFQINTFNRYTHEPLPEVNLIFECGTSVALGETQLRDGVASISSRLPFCAGEGRILAKKEGYAGTAVYTDNPDGDVDRQIDIELWPIKRFNVRYDVMPARAQRDFNTAGAVISDFVRPLEKGESAIVMLEREKEVVEEEDMPINATLIARGPSLSSEEHEELVRLELRNMLSQLRNASQSGDISAAEFAEISQDVNENAQLQIDAGPVEREVMGSIGIIPGLYNISGHLNVQKQITIPEETRVEGGVLGVGAQTITLDEVELPGWGLAGTIKATLPFDPSIVYGPYNTMTFHILGMPIPSNWTDLENIRSPEVYMFEVGAYEDDMGQWVTFSNE